jgi:hypothetical protein
MVMRVARESRLAAAFAAALVVAVLAVPLQPAPAVGQGATGGSIGKQDKSLSGGVNEDRPRSRSTERSNSKSERSSSRGDGSSYDGRYSMTAVGGAGCAGQPSGSGELVISGGRASETGFQLAVSGSGSLRGNIKKGNVVGTLSGRVFGNGIGSGTMNFTNGCRITFTLAKK